MIVRISAFLFLCTLASILNAETLRCKKTGSTEEVFFMNTKSLQALVVSGGRSLAMTCGTHDEEAWRCVAESERDSLHSFEVIISEESRLIEYYGRSLWSYPLTCHESASTKKQLAKSPRSNSANDEALRED